MTPASQANALANADTSRVFDLAVDYFVGMPTWTELGDPEFQIWLTHTPQGEGHEYAGTAFAMYSHTGTHICSLHHLGHDGRFWSGSTAERDLGSRAWRIGGRYPPIIARAVLLDVAGTKNVDCLPDSYAITAEDLTRSGSEQLQPGDVALVRTISRYLRQIGFPFSQQYIESTLVRHASISRSLAALFAARFNPVAVRDIVQTDAALRAEGEERLGIEGYEASKWIVQDYGDIVVHLFDPEARSYYALEDLWADAPHVDWERH